MCTSGDRHQDYIYIYIYIFIYMYTVDSWLSGHGRDHNINFVHLMAMSVELRVRREGVKVHVILRF